MKNTTTLQSKRSITVLLGVLLYFSSLSAQTMQDTIIANFSLMERIPKEILSDSTTPSPSLPPFRQAIITCGGIATGC